MWSVRSLRHSRRGSYSNRPSVPRYDGKIEADRDECGEEDTMTCRSRTVLAVLALGLGGLVLAAAAEDPLNRTVRTVIAEALQDEYQGEAVYARVLKDHGDVRPFSRVVYAEKRHAGFLEELFTDRGLAVPENRWAGAEVPTYASLKEACAAAVEFEVKNAALYDRLLATESLPDDVRRAFEYNRNASLQNHKPAFERCAGWGGSTGRTTQTPGRWERGCRGCGHHGCGHHRCGHHGCGPCGGDGCGPGGGR
jgi:hypothetical protein